MLSKCVTVVAAKRLNRLNEPSCVQNLGRVCLLPKSFSLNHFKITITINYVFKDRYKPYTANTF